jgi:hypothetical protein
MHEPGDEFTEETGHQPLERCGPIAIALLQYAAEEHTLRCRKRHMGHVVFPDQNLLVGVG